MLKKNKKTLVFSLGGSLIIPDDVINVSFLKKLRELIIDLLEQEVESLEGLNDEILNRKVIESLSTYKVEEYELTAYCPCEICCGKYSDGITYSGTHATYGRTIAVDPKVIPIGSTVYIDGIGIRIAEDIGGAIDGKHIDIYFDNHEDALDFGVQNANVIILEKGRKQ